jgi:4'-phosphopantetheinyl transferase
MARVYAIKLDEELSEASYQLLLGKVSDEKRAKIQKFYRRQDSIRSLFGNLLIRYLLIKQKGLSNAAISFSLSTYGKPSVVGSDDLHFNIAHSGDWVVCVMDKHPVGVDVELITPIDMGVAETYFSAWEQKTLLALPENEQIALFFELWTLKESYIKLKGKGLSIPLSDFTISAGEQITITVEPGTETPPSVFFKQYELDPRYKMAVCGSENRFEDIVLLKMQEIIAFWE